MLFATFASLCLLVTASVAAPGARPRSAYRQATRDSIIARSYDAAADALAARQAKPSPSSGPIDNNYCYGFPKGLPPLENHAIYPDRVGVQAYPAGGRSQKYPNVPDVDTCITICTRETVPCTTATFDPKGKTCTLFNFAPPAAAYALKPEVAGGVKIIRSKLTCQDNAMTAGSARCCNAPQTKPRGAGRG